MPAIAMAKGEATATAETKAAKTKTKAPAAKAAKSETEAATTKAAKDAKTKSAKDAKPKPKPKPIHDTWLVYQHDPQHTGRTAFMGPENPDVSWFVPFGQTGKPTTPLAVGEDKNVYVGVNVTPAQNSSTTTSSQAQTGMGHSGVFAFSSEGNKVIWVSKVNGKVTGPIAIGKDGTVYAVIGTVLVALNKADGSAKWQVNLNGESSGGVMLGKDGTVYAGTLKGMTLYAVGSDGKPKWRFAAGGQISSSPAIANDGTVYFTAKDLNLYAVDPSGKLKWKFAIPEKGNVVPTSPIVGNEKNIIFAMNRDGGYMTIADNGHVQNEYVYAIAPDGKQKWRYLTQSKKLCMPAVESNGMVVVAGTTINYTDDRSLTMGDGFVYGVGKDDKASWKAVIDDDDFQGAPIIDGSDDIYISSTDGHLTCISGTGVLRWRIKTGGLTSVGPKGAIYIAANSSVAAIMDRDTSKDAKQSQKIEKEGSGGSSMSILIYAIPVIVAIAIIVFLRTKVAIKPEGDDSTES
jgi:outer membrane protein assembly factor BamB